MGRSRPDGTIPAASGYVVRMLLLLVTHALASSPADRATLESALKAELDRSAGLRLTDTAGPYVVLYDVLDGDVATTFAEFGATVSDDRQPYRNLRVEVRVGDYTLDSSNFSGFGIPDSVISRLLPVGDGGPNDVMALRREAWLATDAAYKNAVQLLARKQAALNGDKTPRPDDWTKAAPVDWPLDKLPAPAEADGDRISAVAARLSGELASFPALELGQAVARDWQGARLLLTSEGSRVWRPTGYTVLRVEGTVRLPDGTDVTDSRSWIVRRPSDLPPEAEMVASVREMATWLTGLPTAAKEDDYLGPVLFEAPAAVEMMSQLLASELVGTPPEVQDGDSMLSQQHAPTARLGRRLLPMGWSVTDDVASAPDPVRYDVDQDGVVPRRVDLVRDGVLLDTLMSRIPSKDRTVSNGHGRSLGEGRRGAMASNVVVTAKKTLSRRALEKQALRLAAETGRDYVLVIGALQPPALDGTIDVAITGESQLAGLTAPYEAWRLYADGHREPVQALRFTGVDRRVLRDIAGAGASTAMTMLDGPAGAQRFTIGSTGGIPVRWEVPAVLITEMEINGGAGGEPRSLDVRVKASGVSQGR